MGETSSDHTWSTDVLNRREISRAFKKVADFTQGPSTFLVHAEFGMGKSFFVANWQAELREMGESVVVFDAWRNDYLESPLAAFIANVRVQAEQIKDTKTRDAVLTKLGSFATTAAPILLKSGINLSVKLLSMNMIDGDIDSIRGALISEGLASTEHLGDEAVLAFRDILRQEATRESLLKDFTEVVEILASSSESGNLIILIDELDRCRPEYTLSLLEDIKHFLEVPKVKFFIFCDEEVLQSQTNKIFGDRKSGEKYISKFFTTKLRLPEFYSENSLLGICAQKEVQLEVYQITYLAEILKNARATMRQIHRILDFINFAFSLTDSAAQMWPITLVLIVAREVETNYYENIIKGEPGNVPNFLIVSDSHEQFELFNLITRILECGPNARERDLYNSIGSSKDHPPLLVREVMRSLPTSDQRGIGEAVRLTCQKLEFATAISY